MQSCTRTRLVIWKGSAAEKAIVSYPQRKRTAPQWYMQLPATASLGSRTESSRPLAQRRHPNRDDLCEECRRCICLCQIPNTFGRRILSFLLEEMFPKGLLNKAKNAQSYYEALVVQKEAYAAAYLQKIGREAKVQDVLDDLALPDMSTEASNLLLEIYWDYPYWIGTEEKIENGVRYIYEKKWESAGNGDGVVAFEKRKEEGTIVEYVEIVVKDDHMTCKAGTPRSGLGQ